MGKTTSLLLTFAFLAFQVLVKQQSPHFGHVVNGSNKGSVITSSVSSPSNRRLNGGGKKKKLRKKHKKNQEDDLSNVPAKNDKMPVEQLTSHVLSAGNSNWVPREATVLALGAVILVTYVIHG